jgi:hypothetical protein
VTTTVLRGAAVAPEVDWSNGIFDLGGTHVQAYRSTVQSCNSGAFTTVIFSTEGADALGEYNPSTGLFTAKYNGKYAASWSVSTDQYAWALADVLAAGLSINGDTSTPGQFFWGHRWAAHAAITDYGRSIGSVPGVALSAGDTLAVKVFHNRGSPTNLAALGAYNYFFVRRAP